MAKFLCTKGISLLHIAYFSSGPVFPRELYSLKPKLELNKSRETVVTQIPGGKEEETGRKKERNELSKVTLWAFLEKPT